MWPRRINAEFESLVRAYSADLFRFAYWLARDRSVAEDLVQESYTRAWKHLNQLRASQSAKSWLFTIVRNEHARLYARPRPEQHALDLDDIDTLAPARDILPLQMEVSRALEHLPDSLSEPLLLQVLGGFSCAEIGIMLNITESNVMTRVSRARRALRDMIEPPLFSQEQLP